MRAWLLVMLAAAVFFAEADTAIAAGPGLHSQPPVVVATIPRAGDDQVDPNLREIRITFSKPMQMSSWSLVMADKASFPKIAGQVAFQSDGRIFVAPVKLEPGKVYVVWVNSSRHTNFRDQQGRPAVPYLLSFGTRP
jgi:hypothetical protein